jgi:hypothetical protein
MSFFDVLRDPVWTSIGVILALAMSLLGWVIPRTRRRKSLTYLVDSNEPLLIGGREIGDLQVVLNGKTVTDARSIALRITNSGKLPIKPNDYERMEGLKIRFNQGQEILSASVTESWPTELKDTLTVNVDRMNVTLPPALLNAGDTFTVRILERGGAENPSVVGRIAGVKSVVELKKKAIRRRRSALFAIFLSVFEFTLFLVGLSILYVYGLWFAVIFIAGMNFVFFTLGASRSE